MPKIPSYEGLQVQEAPTPTPKISTDIPSIEAFGGGKSLQVFDTLDEILLQAKKEADQTFVKDAENKVRSLRNRYLFDQNEGFLNKTVKSLDKNDPDNIFIQSEKYANDFEKGIEDIQKNLSEDQKSALQNSILDVRNNFNESITKHLNNETEIFRKATLTTNISLIKEEAINNSHDINEVSKSIEMAKVRLDELAQMDSNVAGNLEFKKKELTSDIYESIFKKRSENFSKFGKVTETRQLYDQVKNNLLASSQEKIEKLLNSSGNLYEGNQIGLDLFRSYQEKKINQEEGLATILKIEDRDKREYAKDVFTQYIKDFKQAKKDDELLKADRAVNLIIESNGSLDTFQQYNSLFSDLKPEKYKELKDLANSLRLQKFNPKESSPETYGELLLMQPNELAIKIKDPKVIQDLSQKDYNFFLKKLNTGQSSKEFKRTKEIKDALLSVYREAGFVTPSNNKSGAANTKRWRLINNFFEKADERLKLIQNPTEDDARKVAIDLVKKHDFKEERALFFNIFPNTATIYQFENLTEERKKELMEEVNIDYIDEKILSQLKESYKQVNKVDYDKSKQENKRKVLYDIYFEYLKERKF